MALGNRRLDRLLWGPDWSRSFSGRLSFFPLHAKSAMVARNMDELALLLRIQKGQTRFDRAEFPDLDRIKQQLSGFVLCGYLFDVLTYMESDRGSVRVSRVDVVGELTEEGRARLTELLRARVSERAGARRP